MKDRTRVSGAAYAPAPLGAMRYVGCGSYYVGVPARDLTAEEAEQYRGVIEGSPLYEPMEPAQQDAAQNGNGEEA